jgi:hypothetical protein
MSLDDKSHGFDYWWNLVGADKNWDALSIPDRMQVVNQIKQCMIEFANISMSESEICDLITKTDIATVFDAILVLWSIPQKEIQDPYAIRGYLRKVVYNTWRNGREDKPVFYREPKRKHKVKVCSTDEVKKYNPFNFNLRFCECGKILKPNEVKCKKCST